MYFIAKYDAALLIDPVPLKKKLFIQGGAQTREQLRDGLGWDFERSVQWDIHRYFASRIADGSNVR